jgi:thiamine biosynthesis protein ThiS
MSTEPRKRGRQAEAARNNVRILEAAREVFIANPAAPISEVASRAGVGIAALYHRYPSKNALLAQLCLDGQDIYIELVEKALASPGDPWTAYVQWLRDVVAADTHALTVHLAGHFTPDERHASRTVVNGTMHRLDAASMSVAALVRELGLEGRRIAVERNGEIVPKSRYADTPVLLGDKLEIVAAVGGG